VIQYRRMTVVEKCGRGCRVHSAKNQIGEWVCAGPGRIPERVLVRPPENTSAVFPSEVVLSLLVGVPEDCPMRETAEGSIV
jgi:hypothetical protein